ncbi:MAG: hypothetical protein JXA10_11545 [Anaerolineae bacterium]|nr:hypothetical protein [Anaerolineae bacterium]
MAAKVEKGTVIFRRWDRHVGLDETSTAFSSLDDLFGLCLQANDPMLVDRVIIEGKDASGTPRTVTLVFQSVTISDRGEAED